MKIKVQLQKQKDNEFQESLSFKEWLEYFSKKTITKKKDDIKKESKKVSNNPFYHPLQGA